ncbi:MAG: DUF5343 domain-containing protein [Firmicutes bacterium]|nr:DUF5343 domain-containing protein [Bacillota bacterium]
MPRTEENYMPYASPSNVIAVIRRIRDRGLPDIINPQFLSQIGISEQGAHRTIATLQFLGLIHDDGIPTDVFKSLHRANQHEYPSELANVIRSAYESIFKVVDPTNTNDIELNDAFRPFEPASQRSRMVTLFLSLCKEAKILEGEPQIIKQKKQLLPKKDVRKSSSNEKEAEVPTHITNTPASQQILAPQTNLIFDLPPLMAGIFRYLQQNHVINEDKQKELIQLFTTTLKIEFSPKNNG